METKTTICPVCKKEIKGEWTGNPVVTHNDCMMEATKDVREWYQKRVAQWEKK